MLFKNTMKLVVSNFSCFWKLLAYCLIALGITLALWAPISNETIKVFSDFDVFKVLTRLFTEFNIFNLNDIFQTILTLANNLIAAMFFLLNNNLFVFVYLLVIFVFVGPFLFALSELVVSESLYGYMTSLAKFSFTACFIKTLGRAALLALSKIILVLPINLAILTGSYFLLRLCSQTDLMSIIAPVLFSMALCLSISLKSAFLSYSAPSMSVMGRRNPFTSFREGVRVCARKFLPALSTMMVITIVQYLLVVLFGAYILIIVLPMGMLLANTLSMVTYFEARGMRYYVDRQTIITPKKFEEVDKFKHLKAII